METLGEISKFMILFLKDLDWKDKGLIISSYGSQNQIKKVALDTGISKENLICLYENIKNIL